MSDNSQINIENINNNVTNSKIWERTGQTSLPQNKVFSILIHNI